MSPTEAWQDHVSKLEQTRPVTDTHNVQYDHYLKQRIKQYEPIHPGEWGPGPPGI